MVDKRRSITVVMDNYFTQKPPGKWTLRISPINASMPRRQFAFPWTEDSPAVGSSHDVHGIVQLQISVASGVSAML